MKKEYGEKVDEFSNFKKNEYETLKAKFEEMEPQFIKISENAQIEIDQKVADFKDKIFP